MPNDLLILEFLAAITAKHDAEEFERLTLGLPDEKGLSQRFHDLCEQLDIENRILEDEPSALEMLKADRALEVLQARYPDLWEQIVMSAEVVR
jgi:hypothetical protein